MSNQIPPPVNNACLPDIYSKLDANAIEKTKVLNMQLSFRLKLQEKVLSKYRNAAEQRYTRERDKLRLDLRNIYRRMPNYVDIPLLETKIKKLRKQKKATNSQRHDCVFTTEPLDMKGISEKEEKLFCDRFLTHHLPTKSRFYQDVLRSVKKGVSMPDLRPRPSDRYMRLMPIQSHHLSQDSLSSPTQDTLPLRTDEHLSPLRQDVQIPVKSHYLPQYSLSPPTENISHYLSQDSLSPPTQDTLSLQTDVPLSSPTHSVQCSKLLPFIKSLDDNYVPSKTRFADDNDDDEIKTV